MSMAAAAMAALRKQARFNFMCFFSNRQPAEESGGSSTTMLPTRDPALRSLNSLMRSLYRTDASARSDTIFGVMKMINSVLSLIRASFLNSQPT